MAGSRPVVPLLMTRVPSVRAPGFFENAGRWRWRGVFLRYGKSVIRLWRICVEARAVAAARFLRSVGALGGGRALHHAGRRSIHHVAFLAAPRSVPRISRARG